MDINSDYLGNPKKKDNSFAAVCIIYLITLLSFIILRVASGLGLFDSLSEAASDFVFSLLSQILMMFLVPVVGFYLYKKNKKLQTMSFADFAAAQERGDNNSNSEGVLKSWGFKKTSTKVLGYAFFLGVLLFFFNIFVSGFFNGILMLFGYRFPSSGEGAFSGVGGFFVSIILVALLPGLCEETAHRGLLLRGFSARIGVMRAVLLSSLIFGLMHLNIVQCIYAAILGYIIALAVLATRSIWTGVIMHFMNNAIGVYLLYASENGWLLGDLMVQISNFFADISFLFFVAFFVLLYFIMVRIIHKFGRENFIKDYLHTEHGAKLPNLKGMAAIKYYLSANEPSKREPLRPVEKTLLCGIIFLGTVITAMTLVWGFL